MGLLALESRIESETMRALSERVDLMRLDATRRQDTQRKEDLGQFLSPAPIARLMASMLECPNPELHILDAGAGIGSLFSAVVAEVCSRQRPPRAITVTAYEVDQTILPYLADTMALCREACESVGTAFHGETINDDFIASVVGMLRPGLFGSRSAPVINCVIMNPPYLKIHSASQTRDLLRQLGVETSNLYTGFMAVAARLLQPDGEFVAITPRSFCNGPYFRPFRREFLSNMSLRQLHVFDSRQQAFRDDKVLQENVIVHAVKNPIQPERVLVTATAGPATEDVTFREVPYEQVVNPKDSQSFIHIVPDELDGRIAAKMARFKARLVDLGLTVSTGRVIDFRSEAHLRWTPGPGTAPLIYPTHLQRSSVVWPVVGGRKPNAIVRNDETADSLVPAAAYVLVKRFSAKEERRRVVAAVITEDDIPGDAVGFENHLNYFHRHGTGLDRPLAQGLAAFLNSTLVDAYFRQFNGHTQVNATDLRSLPYPSLQELRDLGGAIGSQQLEQDALDHVIDARLGSVVDTEHGDPIRAKRRVAEAVGILKALGLPKAQQNDRSALTLLALVGLTPGQPWSSANDPMRGVTQIMDYVAEHYGKRYAPNTRETIRRFTLHQFVDAGFVVTNPDKPDRPTNSPDWVYQIEQSALALLRTYESSEWEDNLRAYLASAETLSARYAQERAMQRIPVRLPSGETITLSPGGQNVLVKQIIEEFAPRFTPGGALIYVGDTDEKWARVDATHLAELGVTIESHGKIPDVVIHDTERNRLVLIEAVTSHGPVNPKRRAELEELFSGARPGLVFVTAFLTRKALTEYLDDISWETEVWVADHATHLIHFNGERFLGPH